MNKDTEPIYDSIVNLIEQKSPTNFKEKLLNKTSLTPENLDEIVSAVSKETDKDRKLESLHKFISDKIDTKEFEKEVKYELFFGPESLDDIQWLCSLNPAFEVTLYYTNIARKKTTFPITSFDDLEPLIAMKSHPKIRLNGLDKKAIKKYFDQTMFPIEDIIDFRTKIFAALTWGANCHHHENFQEIQTNKSKNHAL